MMMKKILSYILTALLVISVMMPFTLTYDVHGEDEIIASGNCGARDSHGDFGDNVKYKVVKIDDSNERLILEGTGDTAEFNSRYSGLLSAAGIPLNHTPWYQEREKITSVEVKNGIDKLDQAVLCDLSNVKEITLPSSIKELGGYVFMGCDQLTTVHLNEGLQKISYNIFGNTNVEDIYLPKTVEFMDATNFKKLGMDHVTFEEGSPFSIKDKIVYAQNGKEIVYGKPQFEDGAFNIPDGIEKIDDYAFMGNNSIKHVTFPDTLKEIGAMAFYEDPIEGEVVIPNTVTKLGYSVFVRAKITSITIPDSIKGINTLCAECKNLVNVKLSKNLEDIASAFEGCSSLKEITLPDSLKDISFYAFEGSGLTSIMIPDQVTNIGKYAFANCSQLKEVHMGKSVTEINDKAFYNSALESIDLKEGLLTIGSYAFDKSNLKNVNVPSTVTSVSPDAFPIDCEVTRTASPRTTHLEDQTKTSVKNAIQENKTSSPSETLTSEKKEVVGIVLPKEESKTTNTGSIKNSQKKDTKATGYLPLKLKMKKIGRSQVNLSYQKIKKAKAYAIYMAKGKGAYQFVKKQKKCTYKMKHLKKGQYHFYVEAYDCSNKKIAVSKRKLISTGKKIKKN